VLAAQCSINDTRAATVEADATGEVADVQTKEGKLYNCIQTDATSQLQMA
jgi:hypothetical protein